MSHARTTQLLRIGVATIFALVYILIYTNPMAIALNTASITLGDPRTTLASTYTVAAAGFDTGTNIGCIQLDVGTAADGTGDVGLDLSSLALDSQTIAGGTWAVASVDGTTDQLRATNGTPVAPNASGDIVWSGALNGATEGTTYFGVLETFATSACTGSAIDSIFMTFVYKDGELVSLTIDPSLTFACAAVATGQEIYPVGAASETTTVASTALGIDHGTAVTPAANGISAHDLTTTTNASGGFNVYVRHTGLLNNGSTDITQAPIAAAAFPAAGTDEEWAWTSDDSDLGTVLNGAGTGLWTSFGTTNAVIATEAGVSSTTDRVGHQVGIEGTTPAGTYTTTIIYTAVATY